MTVIRVPDPEFRKCPECGRTTLLTVNPHYQACWLNLSCGFIRWRA